MKTNIKLISLALFAIFLVASCEKDPVMVSSVTVSPASAEITEGESVTLKAAVSPSDAEYSGITWSSSNSSVAMVGSDGTVLAVSPGTATVTASAGGMTGSASITVVAKIINVTGVTLDKTELEITEHRSETLKATVSPANASNNAVTWKSTDESVATVSNNGEVTAVSEGKATIMAITKDGAYVAECKVTVTPSSKFVYDGVTYECKDIKIYYDSNRGYDIVLSTEELSEGAIENKPKGNQFCIDIPIECNGHTTELAEGTVFGANWSFFFEFFIGDDEYWSDDEKYLSGTMYFDIDMDDWITLDMKGTDNYGTEFRVYFYGHPAHFSDRYIWRW